jgi:hypothetical protein
MLRNMAHFKAKRTNNFSDKHSINQYQMFYANNTKLIDHVSMFKYTLQYCKQDMKLVAM